MCLSRFERLTHRTGPTRNILLIKRSDCQAPSGRTPASQLLALGHHEAHDRGLDRRCRCRVGVQGQTWRGFAGSRQLAAGVNLNDAGLVDEYHLLVFPVVVGSGKRLFGDGSAATGLTLVDSEVTSAGVTYQVLRPTAFTTGTVSVEDGREIHTHAN